MEKGGIDSSFLWRRAESVSQRFGVRLDRACVAVELLDDLANAETWYGIPRSDLRGASSYVESVVGEVEASLNYLLLQDVNIAGSSEDRAGIRSLLRVGKRGQSLAWSRLLHRCKPGVSKDVLEREFYAGSGVERSFGNVSFHDVQVGLPRRVRLRTKRVMRGAYSGFSEYDARVDMSAYLRDRMAGVDRGVGSLVREVSPDLPVPSLPRTRAGKEGFEETLDELIDVYSGSVALLRGSKTYGFEGVGPVSPRKELVDLLYGPSVIAERVNRGESVGFADAVRPVVRRVELRGVSVRDAVSECRSTFTRLGHGEVSTSAVDADDWFFVEDAYFLNDVASRLASVYDAEPLSRFEDAVYRLRGERGARVGSTGVPYALEEWHGVPFVRRGIS